MQLNTKITHLLFELSDIENQKNWRYLIGDGPILRNNLLKLYRATKSKESHTLIIQIMNEAGYTWFEKLARSGSLLKPSTLVGERVGERTGEKIGEKQIQEKRGELNIVSDQEFSSLLHINELVH